jgi:hypothetical protein
MQLITIDFETYYDSKSKYSLSSMATDEYVFDEKFEVIGVAVKVNNGEPMWMSGSMQQIANWLATFDWENSSVLAHNALFDGFILTQVFGIKPKLWMDTLSMARAQFPWLVSHSLDAIAAYLGLGAKGKEVVLANGKRRLDFTPSELEAYGGYCRNDVHLCYEIAQKLLPITAPLELKVIDMTIRMFTEPVFEGDVPLMIDLHAKEVKRKNDLMELAAVDKTTIMSNDKFAARLAELGVRPPTKVSLKTGKMTYAFAKTDKAFTALLEHDNPDVQALVGARLGAKTTIAETRALRFLRMARNGKLPVYLNYWGAKTTGRMSGGNKCLTGDTVITVLREGATTRIPLDTLLDSDLVWDGVEFVSHGGLVYQGEKEVITYDGVTGTADHKVYVVGRNEPVELIVAKEQGLMLADGSVAPRVGGA